MSSSASRSSYKLVLILTVFALMLPAPVFAMPIEPVQPSSTMFFVMGERPLLLLPDRACAYFQK